ncbi:hypothetical protein E2C01_093955 [Portunus trituberculatus]|uniref:Uncharacterized protein n=1 Tax=Portunus trituberculatus TaxID=210409 RepID=A0A5B7JKG4_PORTR|nr:hypothetical protein [Portunus trituberculatus]
MTCMFQGHAWMKQHVQEEEWLCASTDGQHSNASACEPDNKTFFRISMAYPERGVSWSTCWNARRPPHTATLLSLKLLQNRIL